MAVFDDVRKEEKLVIYDQGVEIVNGEPVMRKHGGAVIEIEAAEPLRRQCQQFLKSMATREPAITDGESGLRVLRVLDAAEQSLAAGGLPVAVMARKEMRG
jgi:predicted dehydrogenase